MLLHQNAREFVASRRRASAANARLKPSKIVAGEAGRYRDPLFVMEPGYVKRPAKGASNFFQIPSYN